MCFWVLRTLVMFDRLVYYINSEWVRQLAGYLVVAQHAKRQSLLHNLNIWYPPLISVWDTLVFSVCIRLCTVNLLTNIWAVFTEMTSYRSPLQEQICLHSQITFFFFLLFLMHCYVLLQENENKRGHEKSLEFQRFSVFLFLQLGAHFLSLYSFFDVRALLLASP